MQPRTFNHALRIPVARLQRRVVLVLPYKGDPTCSGQQLCLADRLQRSLVGLGMTDVTTEQAQELIRDNFAEYAASDVRYIPTPAGAVNLLGRGWGHYNYPAKDVLILE